MNKLKTWQKVIILLVPEARWEDLQYKTKDGYMTVE